MAIVISHTWQEEWIMPYWLAHHLPMFDSGIIIDYASTDQTVEIVRTMAPHWEVRQSRNPDFGAQACDNEVMDIEREVAGWKCVLNTTEFLCGDLPALETLLDDGGYNGARIRPVVLVDPLSHKDKGVVPGRPLMDQLHYGFMEGVTLPDGLHVGSRARLFHRHTDGAYSTGRHGTNHQDILHYPPGALVAWCAFAPWTPQMRARKLQIKNRIPEGDRLLNLGVQHQMDEAQLEATYESQAGFAQDLREVPEYAAVMGVPSQK